MSTSTESTVTVDSWVSQHADQPLIGNSLDWLDAARNKAIADYQQVGLPGIRDEQWRYTNLRAIKAKEFTPGVQDKVDPEAINLPQTDNPRLVFVNGFFSSDLSDLDALSEQLTLAPLSQILENQLSEESGESGTLLADAVKQHFGTSLPKQAHGFSLLNTAYSQDGYVLLLQKNKVAEQILEVLYVSSAVQNSQQSVSHCRNLIIAEPNSKCTIVERHLGMQDSVYLNNTITEIHAGENAHIDHYKLQQESDDAFHIGGVFIQQQASSNVTSHNIALSGLVTRNDINSDLVGQGAHVEMNGLVIGYGRQHIDNHTEVNHAVANCTSDEYYKTILDDQSRSIFRGRIIVAQDAQLTNADQQNNNLLLSDRAEADTKPQLEIYADDVKCSHGATVGQLDPKSLFYLRSRGIDQASATALLTFAFANEVIERIRVDSIREELTQLIAGHLLNDLDEPEA